MTNDDGRANVTRAVRLGGYSWMDLVLRKDEMKK